MSLDVYGHISYFFVAYGMYLLASGRAEGWLVRLVGELCWVILGFAMGMTSIWLWGLIFMCIDIRGCYRWWRLEGRFLH